MPVPLFLRAPARAAALGITVLTFVQAGPAASQNAENHPTTAHSANQPGKDRADEVEGRIKSMHRKLAITAAQEPLWQQVADVMRENQREMQEAIDRRQEAKTMTAIDDLRAYEGIAKAHTKSLEKLIPTFEKLYDNLSSEQKAQADEVFGHSRHHM